MKRMDRMDVSELIELFIQAARGYEEGIEHGSTKKANRNTSIGDRVVEELERRGARQELLTLLSHPVPIVRGRAAAYALRFAPGAAVPVLEEMAEGVYGTAGADAVTSLMMWQSEES